MVKLQDKKAIRALIFLCAATYFISYFTRLNYAAVMAEFIAESGYSKAIAVLPLTATSITYGAFQLISGYLGDRIKPRHIITGGLMLTTLMNLLMPLAAPNITVMTLIWAVNGIAQSMIWPPLVKILTCALDKETYNRATVFVSYGSQSGTIAVYLIAPTFITLSAGWRAIFYFAAVCSLVTIFVWNVCMNRFERRGIPQPQLRKAPSKNSEQANTTAGIGAVIRALGAGLLLIMTAIIIQGMIRDGVTSWMPTFIGETYHLNTSISILSGVILPIFSIIAFEITSAIHKRWLRNELLCAGVLALFAALCSMLLSFMMDYSAVIAIVFSALIVAAMHGVNLILIMMLPASFSRFGNVSMISGLLNFCTYIGSSISTYGMGRISDSLGWSAVIQAWAIVSAIAAICCFLCVSRWKAFQSDAP
ncbi:MAG: MFS transporter [Clostridia bacterium]|nr:MFS transporter [Clostridia bacterium]